MDIFPKYLIYAFKIQPEKTQVPEQINTPYHLRSNCIQKQKCVINGEGYGCPRLVQYNKKKIYIKRIVMADCSEHSEVYACVIQFPNFFL